MIVISHITFFYSTLIGNDCIFGENVCMYDHDHLFERKNGNFREQGFKKIPISIGNNCWIGSGVIILKGVSIGNNCVIAAGAVVTKDIPDGEIWGGIPAKKIEDISEYYSKIKYQMIPTNGLSPIEKEKYLRDNKPELFVVKHNDL